MKRILTILAAAALALAGCEKPASPKLDSACTISSFKCHVYSADFGSKTTVDLLSGTYNPEKGAIIYTFPDNPELFNEESLTRCRLELTVPATATVRELDAGGNVIADGIGGRRSLLGATVYFGVVAADGTMKKYQAQFKLKK